MWSIISKNYGYGYSYNLILITLIENFFFYVECNFIKLGDSYQK